MLFPKASLMNTHLYLSPDREVTPNSDRVSNHLFSSFHLLHWNLILCLYVGLYVDLPKKSFAINENVTVAARGTGEATLMLVSEYYSLGEKTESNCTKFNLSVEFSRDRVDEDNGDIYILRMEFSYNHVEEDASMSILDITLPTGFTPVVQSLDALSEGQARFIAKWEYNKELSGRSSIILYMNKVSHDRTEELAFKMRQTYKVSFLQPASVSIYEYYDETRCVKFYHSQRRDGRILRLCRGDVCQCAEGNCSMQKKGNINNQERLKTACQTSIDFVYHVILEDIHLNVSFDTYTMQIKTVIKEGRVDIAAKHQLRKFLGLSHCRESLDLQRQKGYLIMGGIEDVLPDASNQFEYLLGERTWIEHWPSAEECQMIEYRPTCLGLEALVYTLETVGCALK